MLEIITARITTGNKRKTDEEEVEQYGDKEMGKRLRERESNSQQY